MFHFWEKIFHRNDSQGKVEAHKVHLDYAEYIDKEEKVFKNVYNMEAVSNSLKRKASRVKGSSNKIPKPDEGKDEDAKKEQEESTQRIAVGANKLLEKEAQRDKEEAFKQKSKEVV